MAMMRCPNCSSQITRPTSPWAIVFGIVSFLSVGCLALIFLCVVAIAAVGANAAAEMGRQNANTQIEIFEDLGDHVSLPQVDVAG